MHKIVGDFDCPARSPP